MELNNSSVAYNLSDKTLKNAVRTIAFTEWVHELLS